jgi:GT2 family glycosyltransferase
MNSVPVSVLIVTWNSAAVLPAAVEGLGASDPLPSELVVIDNASADATSNLVNGARDRLAFPVKLLRNEANRGFAAGMNQAIAEATFPFVLLLNPDVRVGRDMIGRLHASLSAAPPDVSGIGPKLLRGSSISLAPTNRIDSTGIVMTRDGRHLDRGAGEVDTGQFDEPSEVFGLSGAAVLFRRTILEASKIDGQILDEDFFAYREDADLAWRLRGFGFRALYEPTAVGYHLRRVTPERRRSLPPELNRHSVKNRFLLRIHHADRRWLRAFGLQSLARDVLVVGACVLVERSSLPAFVWLVRNARTHVRRRRTILTRRSPAVRLESWFT